MKIYLVEDDSLKANRLLSFLKQSYPELSVPVYGSFQSALKAIENAVPDILILDMTLPTFDRLPNKREGRIRPEGGYELMRKLRLKGASTHVIVVTQLDFFGEGDNKVTFSEMTDRCTKEFPDMFLGSVFFRQNDATWQDELLTLLKQYST